MEEFILLGVMIVACIAGLPICFGMLISVIITMVIIKHADFIFIAQRMIIGMDSFVLLAIPLFIFVGLTMTKGGVTRRLMGLAKTIVGHWPGGLAHVNVVSSMLFSGISGTGTADAAGLGQIEIPPMLKAGYPRPFTAAITAASSTIGPIVPPSVPFIIFGAITGVSVGRLFLGGIFPGVGMGIALIIYIFVISKKHKFGSEKKATFREIVAAFKGATLALVLPFLIVGGIIGGVFTPTEAAGVAAVYSLIITMAVYRELSISDLLDVIVETAKVSGVVMVIIGAANIFGQVLLMAGIGDKLISLFKLLGSNTYAILFMVNVLLLTLGCFIEATALIIMLGPIFLPLILYAGIDPVHFGVMMVLAVMIGLITPPVGIVAYIVCDITQISIESFTKAIFPMFVVLVLVLFIIAYVPIITLFVPNLIMGH